MHRIGSVAPRTEPRGCSGTHRAEAKPVARQHKAGLVGPSESIPLIDGRLGLSRWQNIFLCEFDGPRRERQVVVTVLGADED